MKYIVNSNAIVLVLSSGQQVRMEKTDIKYPALLEIFSLPSEEQDAAVLDLLNKADESKPTLETLTRKGFDVDLELETVFYEGKPLPKSMVTKVLSIVRDGLPIVHFEEFWKRLEQNPSATAVNELMDFLSYRELPLTEDGCFLAYKGVNSGLWSIQGNTETTVLSGEVNTNGQILNTVGSVIEVLRRDVDDDRQNECSTGLHVGSKDYATGWGNTTVIVKVDPKDVVSVPKDCAFQKCRVCKYEVIDFYTSEITVSVTDSNGKDTLEKTPVSSLEDELKATSDEWEKFKDRVVAYLDNKAQDGKEEVTVRQIQSAFSPEWPSKEKVLAALQETGEHYYQEDGVWIVALC